MRTYAITYLSNKLAMSQSLRVKFKEKYLPQLLHDIAHSNQQSFRPIKLM